MALEGQFSKGCPGDVSGDSVLDREGEAPNAAAVQGIHFPVHCKLALYPLGAADYIDEIAKVWYMAQDAGLNPVTIHYATRIEGDVQAVFRYLYNVCEVMEKRPQRAPLCAALYHELQQPDCGGMNHEKQCLETERRSAHRHLRRAVRRRVSRLHLVGGILLRHPHPFGMASLGYEPFYGIYFMAGAFGVYVMRKPGAGLIAELLAAVLECLFATTSGPSSSCRALCRGSGLSCIVGA